MPTLQNETLLRWMVRLGSSKNWIYMLFVGIVVLMFPTVENLKKTWGTTHELQPVSLSQLVSGELAPGSYVTASGVAAYEYSYVESKDGKEDALLYPLIDQDTNAIFFVRTNKMSLRSAPAARVDVKGMIAKSYPSLQGAIEKDFGELNTPDYQTSSTLYLEEGKSPVSFGIYLLELLGLLLASGICIAIFLMPSSLYVLSPVDALIPGAEMSRNLKATGKFQEIKSREPLELGRSHKRFTEGTANIVLLPGGVLAIYIHSVMIHYHNNRRIGETDQGEWLVQVTPIQVVAVETGKMIYPRMERPVVSIHYRDGQEKVQSVRLSFDNTASQINFLNFLREHRYPVGSGLYPVTGGVWS